MVKSFSRQLLPPVIALVVLAFGLAALIGTVYGARATEFLVQQVVAKATEGQRLHLQRFLESPQLLVRINADAVHTGEIDAPRLFAKPEEWFLERHRQFPSVDDIYFGQADGAIVGVDKVKGGHVLKLTTSLLQRSFFELDETGQRGPGVDGGAYDARARGWFKTAMDKGGPVWSEVYTLLNRGELGISAAAPALDPAGRTVGVMGVNLTLGSVSEYLSSHRIGDKSVSYIVERTGMVVAASGSAPDLVRALPGKVLKRVSASESLDPVIAASYQAYQANPPADDKRPVAIEVEGEKFWVYRNSYQDKLGLDWQLMTVVDPTPFLEAVRRAAIATLILGAVVLTGLLLILPRFTRRMARPLQGLEIASRRLAAGEWGATVPVPEGPLEVRQLALAFNHMSTTLAQAHQSLQHSAMVSEQLVAERTAELSKLNELYLLERQRAEVANANKTRFLAQVSHEIRTPLNAIAGLAYLMRSEPAPVDGEGRLRRIEGASRYVASIVNSLLDLSKIEAGRVELRRQQLDVPGIVSAVTELLRQEAEAKQVQLQASIAALPEGLVGDPLRLQQALTNLVANAIRVTARGSVRIEVTATRAEDAEWLLQFDVIDTGPGLALGEIEQLFAPYTQGPAARGSVGLGLTITRELARLMGGDAWATSTPGQGSRFSFTARTVSSGEALAPRGRPQSAPAAAASTTATGLPQDAQTLRARVSESGRVPRALVVDDDAVNQIVAEGMLQQSGFEVEIATGGLEGVRKAAEARFDLILMDLSMPDLDGISAAQQMRASGANCQTPIIGFSGLAYEDDRQRALAAGMSDFLVKPVDPELFFRAVRRVVVYGEAVPA